MSRRFLTTLLTAVLCLLCGWFHPASAQDQWGPGSWLFCDNVGNFQQNTPILYYLPPNNTEMLYTPMLPTSLKCTATSNTTDGVFSSGTYSYRYYAIYHRVWLGLGAAPDPPPAPPLHVKMTYLWNMIAEWTSWPTASVAVAGLEYDSTSDEHKPVVVTAVYDEHDRSQAMQCKPLNLAIIQGPDDLSTVLPAEKPIPVTLTTAQSTLAQVAASAAILLPGSGATIDNRSVKICAGNDSQIDVVTYHRGQINQSDGTTPVLDQYGDKTYQRVPNVAAPDGTGTADIAGGEDWYNQTPNISTGGLATSYPVTFTAVALGNWNLTGATGHWYLTAKQISSDGPANATPLQASAIKTFYNTPFWQDYDGIPTYVADAGMVYDCTKAQPVKVPDKPDAIFHTDHIHFRLTDGADGAQETANFYLNVHPTREWYPSTRALEDIPQVVTCSARVPDKAIPPTDKPIITGTLKAPAGGFQYLAYKSTGTIEFNVPSQWWKFGGYITAVTGALSGGKIAGVLALLGVSLDMLQGKPDEAPVTFNDDAWKSPWSTFSPQAAAVTDKNYCVMYPRAVLRWQRHYLQEDTYDKSGFVGTGSTFRDKYTGVAPAGCGIVTPGVWGVFVVLSEAQ